MDERLVDMPAFRRCRAIEFYGSSVPNNKGVLPREEHKVCFCRAFVFSTELSSLSQHSGSAAAPSAAAPSQPLCPAQLPRTQSHPRSSPSETLVPVLGKEKNAQSNINQPTATKHRSLTAARRCLLRSCPRMAILCELGPTEAPSSEPTKAGRESAWSRKP